MPADRTLSTKTLIIMCCIPKEAEVGYHGVQTTPLILLSQQTAMPGTTTITTNYLIEAISQCQVARSIFGH